MSTNFNRIFSDSKVESTNVGKIYEESTAGGNCNLIIDNNSKRYDSYGKFMVRLVGFRQFGIKNINVIFRIVSHDEPESNPSILEAISKWLSTKWALLKTFMFVKIILSFLGPIKTSGLYYYDIYTDFYLMQTLFNNCHPNYGYASLVIIFTSYITTVLFLTFRGNQKPIIALCFPIYHIANIFDQIKNNNIAILNGDELPEEPNAAKRFAYQIVFLESTSESVLQLCLNCLVIRQFGLSVNSTERFIQVTGLFSSLMCICISFGQVC